MHNEDQKGRTGKDLLLFGGVASFIFLVLLLPSLVFISITNKNPELKDFFNLVTQDIKNQAKDSISNTIKEEFNRENNKNQNTQQTPQINEEYLPTLRTTNYYVYTRNGLKLMFATYPSQCNVGEITGDYVELNSINCYTEENLVLLRDLISTYFRANTYEQTDILEQDIKNIINKGIPLNPTNNDININNQLYN